MLRVFSRTFSPFGLAALALACGATSPAPAASSPSANDAAPKVSFSLPSDGGDLVTVPLANARRTVLDFFGPTCEPCAKKVPELLQKRSEIEKKGGRLVLVAVLADGEHTADATKALAKWGAPSSFLVDSGGVSLREANVKDLPSTLVLDNAGTVLWRAPPKASADDVLHALD